MKKILYITTVSRTINAFLVPHIEMLIREGCTVDCACCIDNEVDSRLINNGVNIFNISFTRNPLDVKNMKAFKQLIKIQEKNKYDIIHVHTPVAALYGRLLKVKFPRLKTIYTVHGFHFHKGAPILNWCIYYPIERIMANFTDSIVTMNSEDYERARKFNIKETYNTNGVGVNLALYHPDSFDKNEIRRKLYLKENEFIILMIAEINKNKNHIQMIDAVEILKKRGIKVNVLCAGDGPLFEDIRKHIENRGLDQSIQMLGFRTDIPELIAACDIGILMSHREGLPRNIMELMACKKPVIGTNIRGIRDIIKNGQNGYIVEVGNFTETANKIQNLYENKELLNNMKINSFDSVQKYDIDKVVLNLKEFYVKREGSI
ncbi:glycosyltransferase family 4 protein [Domibacillus sp. A3M-37]|uniref:glycosyltransferase family 4 protein n=1 Tax=Domibacillus sp. A3M-37 TaxID=2962037 RepID=UPI0020B76F4D|nr:glycosyltransferase [Domibacillus sp. A3M-37]MCP3761406.1 glycosyltransferase family 4 protein [Domibacillus sp. A3M-37]